MVFGQFPPFEATRFLDDLLRVEFNNAFVGGH